MACNSAHASMSLRVSLSGHRRLSGHEPVIRRHDAEKRIRPIGDHKDRAQEPQPAASLPPRQQPEKTAQDRQRRLHGKAALIRGLPLLQE
jgi:predicted DCC family thiol-disulfide oxidoreductase YuxK